MPIRGIISISGFRIHAVDRDIGKVHEFFFDDLSWRVRYLVVDTGTWLPGRKVLLSPVILLQPDWEERKLPVRLDREEVEGSPDIDTDMPISRQQEIELHKHFGWPPYWPASGFYDAPSPPLPFTTGGKKTDTEQEGGDPHLRSTREVIGYQVQATDGEIGHVEDHEALDVLDCII